MGYTTEFWGQVEISPPLSKREVTYLKKFSETRRMWRDKGDYYCGTGMAGQDREDDIKDYNSPPPEQPSLWCGWTVTEDGRYVEWNGAEKFYNSAEWMWYIVRHFLQPNPIAKTRKPDEFSFLKGHHCNGIIDAQGEDTEDRWRLEVNNNVVKVQRGHIQFSDSEAVGNKLLETKYCFEQNKGAEKCGQCDLRFGCYTNDKKPAKKYGDWGSETFWTG